MTASKWSDDAFLDTLMHQGDELADIAVAEMDANGELPAANRIFRQVNVNTPELPEDAPEALKRFWAATQTLPVGADLDRVDRGQEAFMRHIFEFGSLMLTRSLPAGYAAPRLTQTLTLSDDLANSCYRRVLAVVQLLIDIGAGKGFQDGGMATMAAQKMRLLHAGVRLIVPRKLPQFTAIHPGRPVSKEDMLGTLMGFSYLTIEGLHAVVDDLTQEEAEDIYYLWQVYGVMMGIHPPLTEPGQTPTFDYIPATLAEAAEFYTTYASRHYVAAEKNPDGVALAAADLAMMQGMIPQVLRALGFGILPKLLMQDALKPPAMGLVGVRPVPAFPLFKLVYLDIPLWLDGLFNQIAPSRHGFFAARFLQKLVNFGRGGPDSFFIPGSVVAMKEMG